MALQTFVLPPWTLHDVVGAGCTLQSRQPGSGQDNIQSCIVALLSCRPLHSGSQTYNLTGSWDQK